MLTLLHRPQPPDLSGQVSQDAKFPSAHGGFSDVWSGVWDNGKEKRKVAIKVLRSQTYTEEERVKIQKRLRREISVWKRLQHDNVLGLHGICLNFGPYASMVCPWIDNGNLNHYLDTRGTTLSRLERMKILSDIAAGLLYLHSFCIVHGDLTGSNILISDSGKACLSDFGLSKIISDVQGSSYFTSTIGGAVRWAAPELYRFTNNHVVSVSTRTDVYSFGSVMLQLLSDKVPYYYLRSDAQVAIELNRGVKPKRPVCPPIEDEHWDFINLCWHDTPRSRPSINDIVVKSDTFLRGSSAVTMRELRKQSSLPQKLRRFCNLYILCREPLHMSSIGIPDLNTVCPSTAANVPDAGLQVPGARPRAPTDTEKHANVLKRRRHAVYGWLGAHKQNGPYNDGHEADDEATPGTTPNVSPASGQHLRDAQPPILIRHSSNS